MQASKQTLSFRKTPMLEKDHIISRAFCKLGTKYVNIASLFSTLKLVVFVGEQLPVLATCWSSY